MNKYRKLGLIHYNGGVRVYSSLLIIIILHDLFPFISAYLLSRGHSAIFSELSNLEQIRTICFLRYPRWFSRGLTMLQFLSSHPIPFSERAGMYGA